MAFTTFQLETPALASGVWELARPAEFSDDVQPDHANFSDVSCTSPGNCTAVGGFERNIDDTYTTEAFTMTMTNGEWQTAQPAEFGEGIQNETPNAGFESVSCTSQGNCTAVGYFDNSSGDNEAFTMTMTDGEWETAQPAVFDDEITSENPFAGFNSVSCASPGNCTAVGYFENSDGNEAAFTMTSTNGEWQTAQPAEFEADIQDETPNAGFESVSCASPGNCTAVGGFRNSSGDQEAFTMTSTNGEWQTAQPAVFDDGVTSEDSFANFFSVSCASPGNCTAVGYFDNSSGYLEAFTMTMTDEEWQTAQPAVFDDGVTSEYPASGFYSVSCASPGNCTAVGFFTNSDDFRRAFTMTSTNGEWELARPAEFAEGVQGNVSGQGFGTYLRSVSCASPGNCTAVGSFTNRDEINEPFTMTSTNGEWETPQPAQFAEGDQFIDAGFNSVSCASPGNCTAVGSSFDGDFSTDAFTMTSTREMPERARPAQFADGIQFDYARFNSVSCATPGNCTAVGFFEFPVDGQDDPAKEAFTMTSTDGEWELARPAEFGDGIQQEAPNARFRSVSCASPGNCTAVGYFRNSSGDQEAFTMTMTDGEWETARPAEFAVDTQFEAPNAGFESVSCASPGNCTAVGRFSNISNWYRAFTMTLIEGVWETAQPAVFDEDLQNELRNAGFNSVSCATPGNCTAVGSFERNSDGGQGAITMTMTDGEWETAQPAEFEADIQNETPYADFESVSCATPGNCTAVGYFRNSSGDQEAFTMTSTDGEWETPQPAVFEDDIQDETPNTSLKSVSCASPGNCTAVGEFSADGDDTMAFIMTMTDGEWETAQPAVFEDNIQNELTWAWFNSVSCASPGNCTAVGGFERPDTDTTEAFTMTTGDDTYSSQSDSESSPTTTAPAPAPAPTTTTPTTTTPTPTITAPPIPSPTTTQPKRVTKRNTQKVAPVVPAKSTSTTTAILEDVAQTTLAPEPQSPINTQPGHGSLGWWILGGSSIIGGSFIISAWWITHSLRRFQITKPSAVTVNS
jgi:hypothetical protein